jgi:hypothetical protein
MGEIVLVGPRPPLASTHPHPTPPSLAMLDVAQRGEQLCKVLSAVGAQDAYGRTVRMQVAEKRVATSYRYSVNSHWTTGSCRQTSHTALPGYRHRNEVS